MSKQKKKKTQLLHGARVDLHITISVHEARARISSRTTIDNETQHPWTKGGFGSFVSIHYRGNERRRRRIATSFARNDFINHKHREIPNRKWKAFCHSLHGILRQVLNIRWHSWHRPLWTYGSQCIKLHLPLYSRHARCTSLRLFDTGNKLRYRHLLPPVRRATALSGQFSDLFLRITWLSPTRVSHFGSTRWTDDVFEMFVFEMWTNSLVVYRFAFLIKLLLYKYYNILLSKSTVFLFTKRCFPLSQRWIKWRKFKIDNGYLRSVLWIFRCI